MENQRNNRVNRSELWTPSQTIYNDHLYWVSQVKPGSNLLQIKPEIFQSSGLEPLSGIYTVNPVAHRFPSEFDQISGKSWLRSLLSLGASSLLKKKKKNPDGLWGRKILKQVFHFQTSLSTAGSSMWEELGKSQGELLTVKMIWFSGKWWKEAPPLLKKSSLWVHVAP